jgi:hypothetical protein
MKDYATPEKVVEVIKDFRHEIKEESSKDMSTKGGVSLTQGRRHKYSFAKSKEELNYLEEL